MSGQPRFFTLVHKEARRRAMEAIRTAPDGYTVRVGPPRMSEDQRSKFHAICTDLERSGLKWSGVQPDKDLWKTLLISGHAMVEGIGVEMIRGLEGELINIRESTTSISKSRGSSLIEYALAFCASHGVGPRNSRLREGT